MEHGDGKVSGEGISDLLRRLEEKDVALVELEDAVGDLEENLASTRDALLIERKKCADQERKLAVEGKALDNLRKVLEDFEAERDFQVRELVGKLEAIRVKEVEKGEEEVKMRRALEEMSREREKLGEEVLHWKAECLRSKEDTLVMREELEKAVGRLRDEDREEFGVDKRVIRQLVVGSFRQSGRHRKEVLELMARILDMSEEERILIGLRQRRRKLRAMLSAIVVPPPVDDPMPVAKLSEMWIEFLTRETETFEDENSSSRPNTTQPNHANGNGTDTNNNVHSEDF